MKGKDGKNPLGNMAEKLADKAVKNEAVLIIVNVLGVELDEGRDEGIGEARGEEREERVFLVSYSI